MAAKQDSASIIGLSVIIGAVLCSIRSMKHIAPANMGRLPERG